jgi:hypothetical protein
MSRSRQPWATSSRHVIDGAVAELALAPACPALGPLLAVIGALMASSPPSRQPARGGSFDPLACAGAMFST